MTTTFNWQQVPGQLRHVAAAGDHCWGVNEADQIFRWNGTTWIHVPGAANWVSVGHDGECWVSNRGGQCFRFHDNTWQHIEGVVNTLGVRGRNDVYATNSGGQIFHWDGHKWTPLDGAAIQIAVGKDGTVGVVNSAGQIYTRDGLHGQWVHVPGAATQIAVHKKGKMAVVNAHGQIYIWEKNTWLHDTAGVAHSIALARGYKHVWVVNHVSKLVYQHVAPEKAGSSFKGYHWTQIPGGLVQISGAGKNVWGVNASDQIYRYNGNGWDLIPGAATFVCAGWDGSVWCCNRHGQTYRDVPGGRGNWQQVEGNTNTLAVFSYNDVYATNSQQNIFHWDGHKWTQLDGAASQIAVGKDGHVAVVNSAGQIFTRDGLYAPWVLIPGLATHVAVHKKGTIAVTNSSGQIYAWHNGNWQQDTTGSANCITLPKGHKEVWVVHRGSNGIFRHTQ
jgi:hypothetical protein